MWRGRSFLVALVVATTSLVVACSGDSTAEPPPLRVDLVDAALAALEDRLGEDVAFFEVNATAQVVNLFVAVEGTSVVQYIYDGESLVGPTEPQAATGTTTAIATKPSTPEHSFHMILVANTTTLHYH